MSGVARTQKTGKIVWENNHGCHFFNSQLFFLSSPVLNKSDSISRLSSHHPQSGALYWLTVWGVSGPSLSPGCWRDTRPTWVRVLEARPPWPHLLSASGAPPPIRQRAGISSTCYLHWFHPLPCPGAPILKPLPPSSLIHSRWLLDSSGGLQKDIVLRNFFRVAVFVFHRACFGCRWKGGGVLVQGYMATIWTEWASGIQTTPPNTPYLNDDRLGNAVPEEKSDCDLSTETKRKSGAGAFHLKAMLIKPPRAFSRQMLGAPLSGLCFRFTFHPGPYLNISVGM